MGRKLLLELRSESVGYKRPKYPGQDPYLHPVDAFRKNVSWSRFMRGLNYIDGI